MARRCPLSPNAVTLIAFLLNVVAAFSLYWGAFRPLSFLIGIVFLTIGGLADAFDGIVARVQDKVTRYGDFLDHVSDRLSDALIAAGWMIGSGVREELVAVALIAVTLNGYIGTQIEATYGERNYDSVGRGEFVLALIVFPIVSYILASNEWDAISFGVFAVAEWLTLLLIVFALLGIGQRLAVAARLERTR